MHDITCELAKLHYLTGAEFVRQLKLIVNFGEFHPIEGEMGVYTVGGERGEDYENLINAARKAASHGFQVYILPNPKGLRTADFIFVQKGIYKLYDLKTIQGKSSAINRLMESIGQTNHVLLNIATDYNPLALARCIKKFFEMNPNAVEVLVFKGNKSILLKRSSTQSKSFFKIFIKKYQQ